MKALSENDQDHNAWPELSELISLSDAAKRIEVDSSLLEYLASEEFLYPFVLPDTGEILFSLADLLSLITDAERRGFALEYLVSHELNLRRGL